MVKRNSPRVLVTCGCGHVFSVSAPNAHLAGHGAFALCIDCLRKAADARYAAMSLEEVTIRSWNNS
jgi:hypothetical protein